MARLDKILLVAAMGFAAAMGIGAALGIAAAAIVPETASHADDARGRPQDARASQPLARRFLMSPIRQPPNRARSGL